MSLALIRRYSKLTARQLGAADALLNCRPAVLAGTRAILDRQAADAWHARVMQVMSEHSVQTTDQVAAFCDAAGVAD